LNQVSTLLSLAPFLLSHFAPGDSQSAKNLLPLLCDRVVALQDQVIVCCLAACKHSAHSCVPHSQQVISVKALNVTLSAQLAQQQAINDTNQSLVRRFRPIRLS